MARAAWLYYAEELTQSQIATKLGVSRSTVIRLLQRAKKDGLVTVSLGVSTETFEAERDIERRFGLQKVRIVPQAEDDAMQGRWIGQVAAETLNGMAKDDAIIAVSWGSTLKAMADQLVGEVTVSGLQIVALIGGLHNANRGTNPYEVAEQLGQFFGAPARALYAPVYVPNAATAAGLATDRGLNEALNMARQADLVVFSMGALDGSATMLKLGYLTQEEQAFLTGHGAVGDIACRWIDAMGRPVELPSTIHPIGITLDDLRAVPDRLAIAYGAVKAEVILATLRGGYATHLVTDARNAAVLRTQDH